ncbi:MAG: hypothetical protein SPD15_02210, partial [Allisonella histaminiformans]|uniref:hypothetical protein n=1 Tax=Allisonella histaminiformans TaxID=209880 RepID=UPI002A8329D2
NSLQDIPEIRLWHISSHGRRFPQNSYQKASTRSFRNPVTVLKLFSGVNSFRLKDFHDNNATCIKFISKQNKVDMDKTYLILYHYKR